MDDMINDLLFKGFPYRNSDIVYWIWLSLACSAGSFAPDALFDRFGPSAEKIFDASAEDYESVHGLSKNTIKYLCDKNLRIAIEILQWCKNCNVGIIPYDSEYYPERLRRIITKPIVLYYKGRLPIVDNKLCVSMVGTRKVSDYGVTHAYSIAHDLASAGVTIISGMALGTDAICHRAAMNAGGYTIAVLGCGIDRAYPPEHERLMYELFEKGTVLTEFCPGTPPERANFPIRNRIISGLSQATVVIEGDKKSGAMLTAKHAVSQGKLVFALPGKVGDPQSSGTNNLIKSGVHVVTCALDVLEPYKDSYSSVLHIDNIMNGFISYHGKFDLKNVYASGGRNLSYSNRKKINTDGPRQQIPEDASDMMPLTGIQINKTRKKKTSREAGPPKVGDGKSASKDKTIPSTEVVSNGEMSDPENIIFTDSVKGYFFHGQKDDTQNDSGYSVASAECSTEPAKLLTKEETGLNDLEYSVLNNIPNEAGISYDSLVRLGDTGGNLIYLLTKLEIGGFIKTIPGGMYLRIK